MTKIKTKEKYGNVAVMIFNHDGKWELNMLKKPLMFDYDWPATFLVEHVNGKINPEELKESKFKIKNVMSFEDKLKFIKQILFGKVLEISTGLLLGENFKKTKLY